MVHFAVANTRKDNGSSSCGFLSYRMLSKLLVLLQVILLMSGCAAFMGFPPRVTDRSADLDALQTDISAKAITDCLATPTEACRNKLITARTYAVDIQFSAFEENLFRQAREAGFAATLTTLGLTAAGAVAGGGTTQVLSAIAAGITGSRAAFEREVLAEHTVLAIHTSMRANRMIVLARIRLGLTQSVSQYPLAAGLTDVEDYYFQGTVLGALIGITKVVGVKADEAERGLAIATGLSQSEAARALRAYANEPGLSQEEGDARFDKIIQAYKDVGGPNPEGLVVGSFIRDKRPETEEWQVKVARRLGLIP
jgi:hypothetical protein